MKRLVATVLLALALCGCNRNASHVSSDVENEGRFRCEAGVVYLITDSRTGVQYLAWHYGEGSGICVLVDADGKPILGWEES